MCNCLPLESSAEVEIGVLGSGRRVAGNDVRIAAP